jgi:hypothetical protein
MMVKVLEVESFWIMKSQQIMIRLGLPQLCGPVFELHHAQDIIESILSSKQKDNQ